MIASRRRLLQTHITMVLRSGKKRIPEDDEPEVDLPLTKKQKAAKTSSMILNKNMTLKQKIEEAETMETTE